MSADADRDAFELAIENARLKKVNTELLEACKTALEKLAWNVMHVYGEAAKVNMTRTYDSSPEIKKLLSAIAKAEGGTE